jgi:KDO2-lipid IV(A) lauroyltransferase
MAAKQAARVGSKRPTMQAMDMFAAYGRYWAETLWVRPRRRSQIESSIVIEGGEWTADAMRQGRGLVVALPHVGNWEFAGPAASMLGLDLVAVAENLGNRRLRDWFVGLRAEMDIDIVLATGSAVVMRTLEHRLRNNGTVALLCDRDLKGRGVPVEFFGEMTTLPAGPVSLALRADAPLLTAAAYFEPRGGHRIVIRPPIAIPGEGDRKERVRAGTQAVAAELEELIRRAPEQWHILQPNWPSDRGVP